MEQAKPLCTEKQKTYENRGRIKGLIDGFKRMDSYQKLQIGLRILGVAAAIGAPASLYLAKEGERGGKYIG